MPDPTPPAPSPLTTTTTYRRRVIVASDALLAQLDSLGRLAQDARLFAGSLVGVLESLEPRNSLADPVPLAALDARRVIRAAIGTLQTAEDRAERTASGVLACLAEYEQTEQVAGALAHRVDEGAAWLAGADARLFGLPLAIAAVTGVLVGSAITRQSPGALAVGLQTYLKAHGRILTNPGTVAVIRELACDVNGFGAGFMLVPPPVADALDSARLTGVSSSSNAIVALGRGVGLFEPTAAAVKKTSSFEFGAPPTSLAQRAGSFPDPQNDPNGEQIRIDRYVEAGKPDRFDVYIAGTVTFDPVTHDQPFDLTSDLNGVGGQRSASYAAVVSAMHDAGISSESPVVLNGYSQGGLLASQVAAAGLFNVHGVVTFGAPSAQVEIPASIPVLTVRNAEDLVPATSGYDINPNAVVVERPAFAASPIPSDWAVPAHRLSYYQETAAVVDQASSSEVRGVLDPLNRFGAGASRVDSTLWVATRVSASTAGRN
ncbi:MAG: hypothetical protein QOH69_2101 [Actinomycetota bacterium]|jgi:hypothetical protein|nr:hypothetical protein [Actinomycetota bacterium]